VLGERKGDNIQPQSPRVVRSHDSTGHASLWRIIPGTMHLDEDVNVRRSCILYGLMDIVTTGHAAIANDISLMKRTSAR